MTQSKNARRNRKRRRKFKLEASASMVFVDSEQFAAMEITAAGTPRYRMHAYSGGFLRVDQFPGERVVVDLSTARLEANGQLPNYLRHKKDQKVGSGTAKIEATHIEIEGELTESNAYRSEIVASHKSGKKWQSSIGANDFTVERIPDGERRTVNNRVFVGPFVLASGALIKEVSFVDSGGDLDNHVSLAAQQQEFDNMNEKLKAWLEANGFVAEDVAKSPKQLAVLTAQHEAEIKKVPEPQVVPPTLRPEPASSLNAEESLAADRELKAAEAERTAGISAICRQYDNPLIKVDDKEVSLEAHAIRTGLTVKETTLEAKLADLEKKSGQASPAGGQTIMATSSRPADPKTYQKTLEASLAINQFEVEPELLEAEGYSQEVINNAHDSRYRGLTIRTLLAACLEANGLYASARSSNYDLWAQAYDMIQASGTSVLSLPQLLENTLNKSLLSSFNSVNSTWQEIASVHSANDFKPLNFVRLTGDGGYRQVSSDGELKHMGMTDAKTTAQADTYGCIMSITRKMIKNDDLSGLQQRSSIIGNAAGIRVEEEFYQIVLGMVGSGFTAAGNNNLETGAGSALALAGVQAAEESFLNRVDTNGKPILMGPTVMLAGTTLKTTADSLRDDSLFGISDTATGGKRKGEVIENPYKGKYQVVISPYINNTSVTDSEGAAMPAQSGTKWFLFVKGSQALSAVRAVFVDGVRTPYVETQEMAFEKLGMQTRSYHDFGFAEGDTEAVCENAGA